ncbi:MAG TPA: FlgD immunoglobulin-like domain containing protein, partial [Rhodothermales bacterium]|nr:FlgD immunoglobulin-like domain containing protein [Rhodothermales bacterium]
KLLVTQMSNQDPLNPMDGQQFAAQLAQFSSVEQLINISDALTSQSDMTGFLSQSLNNSIATGLIGKEIVAEDNHVTLTGSEKATIGFDLTSAASEATVSIKDANGRLVRTLTAKGADSGANSMTWDGRDTNGNALPEGTYTFEVKATDANGDEIAATPNLKGTVDRVTFGQDGVLLWMGTNSVSLGSVKSVQQP